MKRNPKQLIPLLAIALGAPLTSGAGGIDFSSPYVNGPLATATFAANAQFNGQQGWSQSTSSGLGLITTTASSGLYSGGQALAAGTGTSDAYIGAAEGVVLGSSFSFDLYTGANEKCGIGLYTDQNSDGLFQQSESPLYFGTAVGGSAPDFAMRAAGLGSTFDSGVTATMDNWYQITVTLDDASKTASMTVVDLTTGGNTVLANYSPTLTAAQYGSGYGTATGVFARVTDTSAGSLMVTDIQSVPEPASVAFMGVGALALIAIRRRRSAANG